MQSFSITTSAADAAAAAAAAEEQAAAQAAIAQAAPGTGAATLAVGARVIGNWKVRWEREVRREQI